MQSLPIDIILGPPGTGKTTTLLTKVEQYIAAGVHPSEIAFLAFTRKAAEEAISRALVKFPEYRRSDFKYFRTIHSLCFRQLGVNRQQIMQKHHYIDLGNLLGLEIRGTLNAYADQGFSEVAPGDKAVFIENVARNKMTSLQDEWEMTDNSELSFDELNRYARALKQFKQNQGLYDYTDLLDKYLLSGARPKLKVVIVDEAQDLSLLQWRIIDAIRKHAGAAATYCGDDDQSVYRWAGAATEHFIGIDGRVDVLCQTFRVPSRIKDLADKIIERVQNRRQKSWKSVNSDGDVNWMCDLEELSIGSGSYLLLARNIISLRSFEYACRRLGVSYRTNTGRSGVDAETVRAIIAWTRHNKGEQLSDEETRLVKMFRTNKAPDRGLWHVCLDKIPLEEREYYVSCLRNGENLKVEPRVTISTIHGAKGGEADHVVVLSDMTRQTFDEYVRDPDDENRVFYVAVTRAKKSVSIVSPDGNQAFVM